MATSVLAHDKPQTSLVARAAFAWRIAIVVSAWVAATFFLYSALRYTFLAGQADAVLQSARQYHNFLLSVQVGDLVTSLKGKMLSEAAFAVALLFIGTLQLVTFTSTLERRRNDRLYVRIADAPLPP